MDSGADANFMDIQLARKCGLHLIPLEESLKATSLDGKPLWQVTHRSTPTSIKFADGYSVKLAFYEYTSQFQPMILRYPRLKTHNPHFSWSTGEVIE